MDCLEAMRKMDDNQFDLAIVDPPYGISVNKMTLGSGKYKKQGKGLGFRNTKPRVLRRIVPCFEKSNHLGRQLYD